VICQSPHLDLSRIYASHPDHVASGQAAIAAVYPDARNPFAFPELVADAPEAWSVPELWVMSPPGTTGTTLHVEDITANIDRKIRALLRHETQHTDPAGTEQRVRSWNQLTARSHGLAEGSSAEAFQVIDTR
jgi:LmbE family N-acetylglucosaminyl deacetylase